MLHHTLSVPSWQYHYYVLSSPSIRNVHARLKFHDPVLDGMLDGGLPLQGAVRLRVANAHSCAPVLHQSLSLPSVSTRHH